MCLKIRLKEWNEIFSKYKQARPKWFKLFGEGKIQEAAEWRAQTTTPFGAGSVAALKKIIDLQQENAERDFQSALKMINRSILLLVVFILALLTLSVVLCVMIIRRVTLPLNNLMQGLIKRAEQVSAASSQISQSSQQLTRGANEQAVDVEETSSSLDEISSMVKQNVGSAEEANRLMTHVTDRVKMGKDCMKRLYAAIEDIKKSSDDMSGLVKTINEIALQTNILALNAAVEAAHAGDVGKGFSVVAEEVRTLAKRAGEAARNTSVLIDESMKSSNHGVNTASETAKALTEISESVQKSSELIAEIMAASREQAVGLDKISSAVDQMSKIAQSNTATAEESASASETLNAQVDQVNSMIEDLSTIVGSQNTELAREGKVLV